MIGERKVIMRRGRQGWDMTRLKAFEKPEPKKIRRGSVG